ncbi:hypothetical protein BOTBODRAFT_632815 [Botryobasidium botryosum FD-172 SS1]|uniref:Uncharacterized protein n=1 Tax=Botryobasidium botryosum (strain FD-172 SS1) TaxID=930990 RepID=A0A067N002_BOTB1|nr:hypothetical protein BOTBODRAFT_632815 [Botryobasidium botryosum FD-172 SS1]
MSAHTTPISAHPTSSTASPYGNIIASLIFLLNLLTAFSLTSICWLVLIIRWILGSLFAIVRTFLPNEDGDKAPQPPVSFARVEKAHVFTKTAVASWAADKHQPSAPTYPVRYHQAPIHAPSSRFAPLTSSIMPPHRASPTPRTVDADKTRRGPVVPSARSGTSAARALGEVELRPRREARQLRMVKMASEARVEGEAQVKEEATQEHARQVPVAVNDPIGAHDVDLVPVAIYASPRVELAPSSPVLQSSAATDAQADVSTVTRHNPALFPVHEETSAPLAPCFHVVPYSTVVDDMECDERPPAPEPMSISVDDVAMSVDYPSPSEEYMDEMLSLPGVMITSCEDDELVGSLRACSLSCLSPMLPPMDVEPDAPVAEVTFSLSKCSLSDTYVLSEMDVDEDDMVCWFIGYQAVTNPHLLVSLALPILLEWGRDANILDVKAS